MYTVLFVLENAKTKINYSFFGKWHLETLPNFMALHIFTHLLSTFCFNVPDFYLEGVCKLLVYPFFSSRQFACHYLLWVISDPRVFNQWWEPTSHFLKRSSHSVAILELVFCCCIWFLFFFPLHILVNVYNSLMYFWVVNVTADTPRPKKNVAEPDKVCVGVRFCFCLRRVRHTPPRALFWYLQGKWDWRGKDKTHGKWDWAKEGRRVVAAATVGGGSE